MLKIVLRKPDNYKNWSSKRIVRNFVAFSLGKLNEIRDDVLSTQIISQIKFHDGFTKTTSAGRFSDLDKILVKVLKHKIHYRIHDLAVSDGITSVDLLNMLESEDISSEFIISDKYSEVYMENFFWGRVYRDSKGLLIHADIFGVYASRSCSNLFFISRLLGYCIPNAKQLSEAYTKIHLLSRPTIQYINDQKLTYEDYDIFSEYKVDKSFDIVRCMNILNLKYFTESEILQALYNIRNMLKESGLMILGRTNVQANKNMATIYMKTGNQFTVLKKVGQGSEIDYIINRLN